MKAVVFREPGGVDKLEVADLPEPTGGDHRVVVDIKACALNHLDLWVRKGTFKVAIPMPHICGSDAVGVVAAIGDHVHGLELGQRVLISPGQSCGRCVYCVSGNDSLCEEFKIFGFQTQGGYAERAAVHSRHLLPLSDKLSFAEWAAEPLVFLTAWNMLMTRAHLRVEETVLVHAAGSGLGSAAVQVAKLGGAMVITTVGSDDKIEKAKELGADVVINYRKEDFEAEVKKHTGGRGVNVIVEHVGQEVWAKSLRCLAKGGRMVCAGTTTGAEATVNIRQIFANHHSIIGCYMGSRKELLDVLTLFENGRLQPVVDSVMPLEKAREAHRRLEERKQFGKVVLTME